MDYEELIDYTTSTDHTVVLEAPLPIKGVKGICRGNYIIINSVIDTQDEKKCILAEEIGHYKYTVGDIIDLKEINNLKQEIIARRWAYRKMLPLSKITEAYDHGVLNRYEFSKFTELTEEFIQEAVDYYRDKYGQFVVWKDYVIYFEPLAVMKKL